MPTFIDGHSSKGISRQELERLVNLPPDEYGITHKELFFNKKEDRLYCILDAPNEEAIRRHHEAAGFKCDFITQVDQIKTEKLIKDEKFATVGRMSSNISHDLRNPIAIIKNSIDLISIKYKDELNPGISNQFEIMERAIFNMNSIISDILNFARTQPLNLEEYSLAKTITRSVSTIKIPANIKIIHPQNDVTLKLDIAKLESAFYNIILNAIQSIGDSQGEIIIRIIEKTDDIIQIQIQNSGPPIPDELMPRIFEPLFTTKKRGTGLGLPSCKNIVEQHYGTLTASNNPTMFTITLPRNIDRIISASKNQNL